MTHWNYDQMICPAIQINIILNCLIQVTDTKIAGREHEHWGKFEKKVLLISVLF